MVLTTVGLLNECPLCSKCLFVEGYQIYAAYEDIVSLHVGKRRRSAGGFLGADVILQQLTKPPSRRRVGFTSQGPPPRTGTAVLGRDGEEIGVVSSATYSPSVGSNVGMAFVPRRQAKVGSKLQLKIRNKTVAAEVVKMPFVPANYYKAL